MKSMILIVGIFIVSMMNTVKCDGVAPRFAEYTIKEEHSIAVYESKASELKFSSRNHYFGDGNVSHYYWVIKAKLTTPSNAVEIIMTDGDRIESFVLPRKTRARSTSRVFYFCHDGYPTDNNTLRVILNTRSDDQANVKLTVSILSQESTKWSEYEGTNGKLQLSKVRDVSFSKPVIVELLPDMVSRFPSNQNLLITIDQPDADRCFNAIVQRAECDGGRHTSGELRQTMRNRSVFIVDPASEVFSSGLKIKVTATFNDDVGEDIGDIGRTNCSVNSTETAMIVTISSNASNSDYAFGILFILGIIFAVSILTVTASLLQFVYKGELFSNVEHDAAVLIELEQENTKPKNISDLGVEIDKEHEEEWKETIHVTDLAKNQSDPTKEKEVYQMTGLYWPLIILLGVFYAIPAFQLVSFDGPFHTKSNQDLCYFNFLCLKPVGKLSAFNGFFSNVGYICVGLLFISLVYLKEKKLSMVSGKLDNFNIDKFGVSHKVGIFYAMGLACVMEGVMSSCYHICPKNIYFQFDTTFMFLIGILIIVKLYQNRHPDITLTAVKAGSLLGIILVCEAVSYYESSSYVWIFFCIVYLILIIVCVTLKAFSSDSLIYDHRFLSSLVRLLILEVKKGLKGVVRMAFVAIVVLYNFAHIFYVLYYLIEDSKLNASQHILVLISLHVFIYTSYYIVMKLLHKEVFTLVCTIYFVLAVVLGLTSVYFFQQSPKKMDKSPSVSRGFNEECLLFNFYDSHDLWHFLSAGAIFSLNMFLLNIDEDLKYTRRNMIPVF